MSFARRRSAKAEAGASAAPPARTVAVVGSGISGLGAAWMLNR
jgi:predicted NAD/FAD-binding protein